MILLHAELGAAFPLGAKLGYIPPQSLDLPGAGILMLWRHASSPKSACVAVEQTAAKPIRAS
jgi:hypothetical protein